jgi:NitT/TauT family transport system permease protein
MSLFFLYAVGFSLLLTALVWGVKLRVRRELTHVQITLLTTAFVGLIMLGWWALTRGETIEQRALIPLILPSPQEVLEAFPKLHFEQALVRSAVASFERVTKGFAIAAILAVPLGVYMASYPGIAAFFRPLALIGAYVPIVVFIPLTLAWFGASDMQKIAFLAIGCFVALLPLVIRAIDDVPRAYLDVAGTKGATQWQLVWHVLFPVSMAQIWENLRAVYGVGWGWIILAEVVSSQEGLGYLISMSERRGHTNAIFAIIIVIVVIAIACDQLWRLGARLLFPYKFR